MSEVVPQAVIDAIDDVSAILAAKAEAGEEDHATDPELDAAVERFGLALDLNCPDEWTELNGVQRAQTLALELAMHKDTMRARVVDLLVRWLEKRIADTATSN